MNPCDECENKCSYIFVANCEKLNKWVKLNEKLSEE